MTLTQHVLTALFSVVALVASSGGCLLAPWASSTVYCASIGIVLTALAGISQVYRLSGDAWVRRSAKAQRPIFLGPVLSLSLGFLALAACRFIPVPPWLFVGTLLPMPVIAGAVGLVVGLRLAERAQAPQYLCADCGYDLRGCTHARCPECGRQFSVRRVRKAYRRAAVQQEQRARKAAGARNGRSG